MNTIDLKAELENKIFTQYGVAVNQIYKDNDKREPHRYIRVLGVTFKDGKATCASCSIDGRNLGHTVWIRFDRLNSKAFTLISNFK